MSLANRFYNHIDRNYLFYSLGSIFVFFGLGVYAAFIKDFNLVVIASVTILAISFLLDEYVRVKV